MVQTTLIFTLGFLAAAFMAVAAAPAIWRRACALTRNRIEGSMPLTLNELHADKDQLRAEFAICLRKLEVNAKSLQEKLTEQRATTAIYREKNLGLNEERATQDAALAKTYEEREILQTTLAGRENELLALTAANNELNSQVADLNTKIRQNEWAISQLEMDGDAKRIELVAKMTEIDQLNVRQRTLTLARKAVEEKQRISSREIRTAREALRKDAKKIVGLERETARLVSAISDRDERLERRENELARLKENADRQSTLRRQLDAANQQIDQLKRKSTMNNELGGGIINASNSNELSVMKKLEDDNARLMAVIRQLMEDKDSLVSELKKAKQAGESIGDDDAQLRNQVHELTAKVVSITAEIEGAKSPINKLLQIAGNDTGTAKPAAQTLSASFPVDPESLADRILSLQKTARSG